MKNKKTLIIVLVVMVLAMAGVAVYYWYENAHYVDTEDAKVDGTIFKVSPQVSGRILEINVDEGDTVRQGDIIARLDDINLPGATAADLSVVKSPISGKVIKRPGNVGEIGAPGQPLVMIVDESALYVTANIEEDSLGKVKVGQKVDLTVDSLPGQRFTGRVKSIGDATLSAFSLLPANTGGSFTKVVQRIPVKIYFDDFNGKKLHFGSNAIVKIHIK